jgi:predicted RNase H-like HicB family nuclease
MTRKYMVVYEFANGGYTGFAPDLQGCIATGATHEEMHEKMHEAVVNHVAMLVTEGREVPEAVAHIVQCPKPLQESDVQHWIVERMEIRVPVLSGTRRKLKRALKGAS